MKRRTTTLILLLILGLGAGSGVSFAAVSKTQGVSMTTTLGAAAYGLPSTFSSMVKAKAAGVNAVAFIFETCQADQYASRQFDCPSTPTGPALRAGLRGARRIGLRTALVMHQEAVNGRWRGDFCPRDYRAWFYAYRIRLLAVARLAQEERVTTLVIGSEMPCLSLNAHQPLNEARWRWLVRGVRRVYAGQLTYGAQRDSTYRPYSELDQLGFWDALDVIGSSAYYSMSAGTPTVATLRQQWERVAQNSYLPLVRRWRKKVMITEVGFRSIRNAQVDPYDYQRQAPVDMQAQARSYEAVIDMVRDHSFLSGMYLWSWDCTPTAGGLKDTGYTPQGKPAQGVMARLWRN